MRTSWPTIAKGTMYEWKPYPGFSPSLGERIMWIAAGKYAMSQAEGKSESVSQMEAERIAFQLAYGVGYLR
jgi:hypothetical protein